MFMNKLSFDHVGLTVWKLITIDRRLLITVHLSFVNGTQGCDAQNDNIIVCSCCNHCHLAEMFLSQSIVIHQRALTVMH